MSALMINVPTKTVGENGYSAECEFALEPSFSRLVIEAKKAGWDELQIALSIISHCELLIYGSPNERTLI